MRFMPMGRPIRPRPSNPIFVEPTVGFNRDLLGISQTRFGFCTKRGDDCSRIAGWKQRSENFSAKPISRQRETARCKPNIVKAGCPQVGQEELPIGTVFTSGGRQG